MATDLVKCAENQVRRLLGIKSRFHTSHLDARLRQAADEYFAPLFPKIQKARKDPAPRPIPEYEALYEAKSEAFSKEAAERIEQSGWNITKKLVETFEETEESPPVIPQAPIEEAPKELVKVAFSLLLSNKQEELCDLAKAHGLLLPSLAEQMNETALNLFSDVAVEEENGHLTLIEDYKEDIFAWLNR